MDPGPDPDEYSDLDSTEVSDQDADKEYEVEKILASKQVNGQDRYLVLWKGYPIDRSTWEPVESFNDPNTVLEWRKTAARQKKGLEPEFDWREWDKQRLEDERKTFKRRNDREIKRQQRGWYRRRTTYGSESELDGFVVSDDAILSDEGEEAEDEEETSSSSSEGELDPLEKVRKRKKAPLSHESDDASDDSLMRSARRKHRTKKRLKFKRKHGHVSDRESAPNSPRALTDRARIEKRKRAASPSEALSGAARNLSLETSKHEKTKHHDAERQVKKQKLQAGIKIVAKPPRPGPSRLKQRKTTDPSQVRMFSSLSHVNRVYKQGQVEPPPDISKLDLFNPGQPSRVLPPIPRRTSISQVHTEPTVPSRERPSSPPKVNKSILYANYKIPKRKPTAPTNDDDSPLFLDPDASSRMDNDMAGNMSRAYRAPNVREGMNIDSSIPHTLSPDHMMEIDSIKPVNPRLFVCNLEHGPRAAFIGEAKFTGFSTTFVEELYNKQDCRALWISKFYGQNYVKEYFAPHYGHVLQDATIEIDPDQVQPLINALAFLKGAGVVLHPDFTMLIFLPSNTDLDRKAFKLPQISTTGTNKIRPSLRAVVYPALEGISIPSRGSNPESQNRDIMRAIESPPSWEKELQFSLPAYLADTTNCNWNDLLGEKEGIERIKGKESKETSFVFLYPPIAEAESKEFKQALECLNRKVVDLNYFRNHLKAGHAMMGFTILIHQSLRRHLHLLPDVVRDHNKEARNYWLYGTKIEERNIEEKPQKIWPSGSLIFMTPQLLGSSPEGFKDFLAYANHKAATTKLALPSVWEERVMEAMQESPSEEVLNGVFETKRKIESGTIILISVDLHLENCNELETYIDIFALYQLENPFEFRRFGFGHPTLPDAGTLELFRNIVFLTPEILLKTYPEIRKQMIKFPKEQENRNKQAYAQPSSSSGSAVKRDLPQGPERRS